MLVLSPRAVDRLESYKPAWPLPKLFRMVKSGKVNEGIFQGETINTPSLLAVEDALDGLRWAESIGGLPELIRRSEANLRAVIDWQSKSAWCDFLARRQEIRSNTSICLQITDPGVAALEAEHQAKIAKDIAGLLEKEGVAFDIGSYRDAPPGLRIWGGATVETHDIEAILVWLDYAFTAITSKTD
jgi:phosphoserine aminotransferase